MIFDQLTGKRTQLAWDANGNLALLWMCGDKFARFHDWDDENRLRMVLDHRNAGYYGYDANGDRVYKLTGRSDLYHETEELSEAMVYYNHAVLYPNPFVTITGRDYTKHYYANGERLATSIGAGGFCTMVHEWISLPQTAHEEILLTHWGSIYSNEYPFEYFHEPSPTLTVNEDVNGNTPEVIQYGCRMRHLRYLRIKYNFDLLYSVMSHACEAQGEESEIFYAHGDHLGSANWITDFHGDPIQYLHYLPYGQMLANQTPYGYDERYKFTGKERDGETGYDYFGARYYMPLLYHWTKVDPLVDDYLHISPYAYCNWNPVKYVDPDGMDSRDVIIGYSLGVLTSLIPGTSFLRDIYTPNSSVDYNTALANVDNASLIVGSGMAAAGASGVGAGTAIAIAGGAAASTVVGAPEGVAIAVGGAVVMTGSEALVAGGTLLMTNAASNKAQGYNRGGSSKSTYSSTPKTINQLQQDVKKGKAPKGITDFHSGKVVGEQDHVHFKDGSALNKDGTWKHGNGKLTNEQKQYLKQNGWNIEQ